MTSVRHLYPQGGKLVERRLHQRKWKWMIHGSPKHQFLTSITPVSQDELMEKSHSLFVTTETGFVFEYQIPKPGKMISILFCTFEVCMKLCKQKGHLLLIGCTKSISPNCINTALF